MKPSQPGALPALLTSDNSFDNYIIRGINPNFFVPVTDNVDHADFEGVEIQASYDGGQFFAEGAFTHYLHASFGCPAYATADDCRGGSYDQDYAAFSMPPANTISLTLGARFLEEQLTLGARALWVDERKGGRSFANRTVFWNDYTVFDLFGSYKVSDTFSVDFSVENLTDRFYMDALNTTAMPAPGRTFRLEAMARF